MPSDLIYREDAKDYARHAMAKGLNVLEYLDEVPAADFRPVVRGKWLWAHGKKARYCSRCYHDEPYKFADEDADVYNYCPNCGADMREES